MMPFVPWLEPRLRWNLTNSIFLQNPFPIFKKCGSGLGKFKFFPENVLLWTKKFSPKRKSYILLNSWIKCPWTTTLPAGDGFIARRLSALKRHQHYTTTCRYSVGGALTSHLFAALISESMPAASCVPKWSPTSTDLAQSCLTSVFEWELVFSSMTLLMTLANWILSTI